MIQRVYEGAKQSTMLTDLVVATDDERIFAEVERFGGKVCMTASHHQTGTDRCAEVIATLPENYDVVINIQGDEPLVNPLQLDSLLTVFHDSTVDIATLASRSIEEVDLINPNRIKLVVNHEHRALYFSRSAVPNFANAKGKPLETYPYLRHIGLYAYRSAVLSEISQLKPTALEQVESLEQLRWLYYGYSIKVVETDIETPNIDVPEDVVKVLEFL